LEVIGPHLKPGEGTLQRQDEKISLLEKVLATHLKPCEAPRVSKQLAGRPPQRLFKDHLRQIGSAAHKLHQRLISLLADESETGRDAVRNLESVLNTAALIPADQVPLLRELAHGAPPSAAPERVREVLRMLEHLEDAAGFSALLQPHGQPGAPHADKFYFQIVVAAILNGWGLPDLSKSIARILLESVPEK